MPKKSEIDSEIILSTKEQRIIIPTVYRNNYLTSLKALSHNQITEAFIRTLAFAQDYISRIDWSSLKSANKNLQITNAFVDQNEADMN